MTWAKNDPRGGWPLMEPVLFGGHLYVGVTFGSGGEMIHHAESGGAGAFAPTPGAGRQIEPA
jgi:hypothetical protein